MRALADAARATMPVQHAADSVALTPVVAGAIRAGDVVLVKGSLGSRMAPIVDAITGLGRGATRAANGS
jgi:UDP-N-acetylmuramoyl-tripeptide--D-alanyl-D-alanine ligase